MASTGSKNTKKTKGSTNEQRDGTPNTSKPTVMFKSGNGRSYTLSVAIPGSIIANCQSQNLKTSLAGQIGRALAVFCVDEVVIFEDGFVPPHSASNHLSKTNGSHPTSSYHRPPEDRYNGDTSPSYFLAHLLSYLETPPYLRRSLFGRHPDLRIAGSLPSLDMPHHSRANEHCRYREGVTVSRPSPGTEFSHHQQGPPAKKQKCSPGNETTVWVDVGLPEPVTISEGLPLTTRVTVRLDRDISPSPETARQNGAGAGKSTWLTAIPVAPSTPREEGGFYWGYIVRTVSSLSEVFTECPFEGGYDVSIGTSERGIALQSLERELPGVHEALQHYKHLLLVFGGVAGLEKAATSDDELKKLGIGAKEIGNLFDAWVNLNPRQGSRTIRTEEALWIGLMGMNRYVDGRAERNSEDKDLN